MNHHFNVENTHRRHQNRGLGISPGSAHREPVYWVGGVRHRDGASSILALVRNCKSLRCDVKEDGQEKKIEALSTDAQCRGGPACNSDEAAVMAAEQRGRVGLLNSASTRKGRNA